MGTKLTADRDEILERTDLLRLVEASGVQLRKAGAYLWRGLCPIHQERTPSFFIWEHQQHWWCFGHGSGGTAVDYRMQAFDETCAEAFRNLRDNAGVRIVRTFTPAAAQPKPAAVPGSYVTRWHERLMRDRAAIRFLKSERFIAEELITRQQLGLWRNKAGSWYLTIPVMDPDGYGWADVRKHLIKQHPEDSDPAKELPFSSGRVAVPFIPLDIDLSSFVLLTEGPMDCLAAASIGLPAVTNTCGTHGAIKVWREHHTSLIQAPKVVICFDADGPGRNAAQGHWDNSEFHPGVLESFPGATILNLPDGVDLTDALKAHGANWLTSAVVAVSTSPPSNPPVLSTDSCPSTTPAAVAA